MDEIKSHDFTTNGMAPKTQSFKADVTGYVLYFLDKKQTVNTEIEFHFEKAAPDFTDKSTKPFVVHINRKHLENQTHLRLDLNKSFSFWFTLFIIFVVMYMLEEKGLVLEGGGFRGMYTCGVIDVFMENHIDFNQVVGSSAGAAFGCNIKSKQIGRALRYNKRFCRSKIFRIKEFY